MMRNLRSQLISSTGLAILIVSCLILVCNLPVMASGVVIAPGESGSVQINTGPLVPGESGTGYFTLQNNGPQTGDLYLWLSDINEVTGDGKPTADADLEIPDGLYFRIEIAGLSTDGPVEARLKDFPQSADDAGVLRFSSLAAGQTALISWEWSIAAESPLGTADGGITFNLHYSLRESTTAQSGESGAADPTRTLILEMDETTVSVGITDQGRLTRNLSGATLDNRFYLNINSGTRITASGSDGQTGAGSETDNLSIPQKIIISTRAGVPELPDGWVAVSPAYEITGIIAGTATGLRMDAPALLVIKYDDGLLPEAIQDLATFYYDGTMGWTQVSAPEGFLAEGPELAAEVDHFSLFMVMAKSGLPESRPPANIVIQKLSVDPPRIAVGQTAEVSVKVINKGGQPGDYDVILKMNGRVQKTQIVHLDPGKSTEIALLISPSEHGIYTLTVGEANSNLVVAPAETADVKETDYWWLLCLAMGITTLLFALIRRKGGDGKGKGKNQAVESK